LVKLLLLQIKIAYFSSGSGKTTLLNALNYSCGSAFKVNGHIMLNGCEANSDKMSMVSGYIKQDDLFFSTLTVGEHLIFHVKYADKLLKHLFII
jgi:ABC-type multidrug transport system ATPase subunit